MGAHTGGVRTQEEQWRTRVEHAVLAGNSASLRDLYAEAVELFGPAAGEHWAEVLSAYDSTAITG